MARPRAAWAFLGLLLLECTVLSGWATDGWTQPTPATEVDLSGGTGAVLDLVPHDPDLLRASGRSLWTQAQHGRPVLADHTQAWDAQDRVSRPLLLALEEGRLSDAHPLLLDLARGGVTTLNLEGGQLLVASATQVRRSLQLLTRQDGPMAFDLDKLPGPGSALPPDAPTGPIELSIGLRAAAGTVVWADGQPHALADDGSSPLDVPGDGVRWARIASDGLTTVEVGGRAFGVRTPKDWTARTHAVRLVVEGGALLRTVPRAAPSLQIPTTGGGLASALGWGSRGAAGLYMLWGLLGALLLPWGLRTR
jgi:hypothetical protein